MTYSAVSANPNTKHKFIVLCVVLFSLFSFQSLAYTSKKGYISKYLRSINYGVRGDGKWKKPTEQQQRTFKKLFEAFILQDMPLASHYGSQIGYQVVEYFDTKTQKIYYVLKERAQIESSDFIGGGTFVYNPNGLNAILQAPHPKNDSFTGKQSVNAFLYTGAKMVMLAGTHRHSSQSLSQCTNGEYSASDMAHQTNTYFNLAHQFMSDLDDDSVFIQYHGFGKTTMAKLQAQCNTDNDLMLNLSESVNYYTNNNERSIMHELRRAVDKGGKIKACVYGNDTKSLGGTWNVQARYTNGSHNTCSNSAVASSKRFLHLEQSYLVRRNHKSDMQKYLKQALEAYFE